MATPARITNSNDQRQIISDLMHDRNEYQRIRRLTQKRRGQKKQQPEGKLVNTLNANPHEEFAPLQSEEEPVIRSAYEDEEPETDFSDDTEEEPREVRNPPNKPADTSTIPNDLAQERAQAQNQQRIQRQQPELVQAVENQIIQTQEELSELTKNLKSTRKKEKQKKEFKEIIKGIIATGTILGALYYILKIILIKMLPHRDGKEARGIKKQIKAKQAALNDLSKQKNRTILLQRQQRAA